MRSSLLIFAALVGPSAAGIAGAGSFLGRPLSDPALLAAFGLGTAYGLIMILFNHLSLKNAQGLNLALGGLVLRFFLLMGSLLLGFKLFTAPGELQAFMTSSLVAVAPFLAGEILFLLWKQSQWNRTGASQG